MRSNRTSRESESRNNERRPSYEMDYSSPLSLPPGVKKEGYSYAWVRKDIRGQDDYRVEDMMRKRWEAVPADRAPAHYTDPFGRNPVSKQFLCYKDVIVMERPAIETEMEIDRLHKISNNKIKDLRGVDEDIGSFTRRVPVINSF